VDESARLDVSPSRLDDQSITAAADDGGFDRPDDAEVERLFVDREVARHRHARLYAGLIGADDLREAQAGQIVDAVDRAQRERRPPELPRPARRRRSVDDDEPRARLEAEALQVIGRREPGLTRTDDDDVDGSGKRRRGGGG